MKDYSLVEHQIKSVLSQVVADYDNGYISGDTQWTRRIKELLGNLGASLDYDICCGGFPKFFNPEWLFDLVWFKNNTENLLSTLPLVVESEWNTSLKYIRYDFEKLLASNAEHRLMVCQSDSSKISVL